MMEEHRNPFKLIEPDVSCPSHIKKEIVSEIDTIRNSLKVVQLYAGDVFDVLSAFAALVPVPKKPVN